MQLIIYLTYVIMNVHVLFDCRLDSQLGSGQFGVVFKGVWRSSSRGEVEVAVKTLKEGSGEEDRVKFLQEAAIMGQFKHPNVVEMYGVVTAEEPVSNGCLLVYRRRWLLSTRL